MTAEYMFTQYELKLILVSYISSQRISHSWCAWQSSILPDLFCQEENEKQETKNADELKNTVKETWASIPPQQCHKLITSMPRRIEAVIKAKGAPTKYWVHIQQINILSRRPTIHYFFIVIIGLMKYSNLLR